MYDLILRGGTLYDGSGRPGQRGDLAIADGRIAALGDAPAQPVAKSTCPGSP